MTTHLVIATVVGVLVAQANAGSVRRQTADTNQTSDNFQPIIQLEQPILFKHKEYTDKICKNQPTCNVVKYAPENMQQMGVRNCMCDEDCRRYGDCCLDSPFYNETEQKANYQTYYCSTKDSVYQMATCPEHYTKADVRAKCESSVTLVNTHDVKLITPVTSIEARVTYASEYCAQCHGNSDYQPWTQTHYCTEDAFQEAVPNVGAEHAERDYLWETTQAAKYVKFDSATRTFRSQFNNRSYTCPPAISLPETLRPYVRLCVPTISNCTNTSDRQSVERCRGYTLVVYDQDGQKRYRNRDCAICNGHTTKLPGCVETDSVYGASAGTGSALLGTIYMLADCPVGYPNNTIRQLCRNAADETTIVNTTVLAPVTDLTQNITYGNAYCAQCHGISNYQAWTVVWSCSPQPVAANQTTATPSPFDSKVTTATPQTTSGKVLYKPTDYNAKPAVINATSTAAPSHPDIVHYRPRPKRQEEYKYEIDEAAKYAKFDPATNTFRSFYKGSNYTCTYQKTAPANQIPVLRFCTPSTSSCPAAYADFAVVDRCRAYTAVVYVTDYPHRYRNQDCAKCNGNTQSNLPGCSDSPHKVGASILFSGGNRGSGSNTCTTGNTSVKNKFCP